MQQRDRGNLDTLVEKFTILLNSYSAVDLGTELNPVDAFFAYRLLLGRNPDAITELPALLSTRQTFREFLTNLLNSPEFYYSSRFFPPNRLLMAELDAFRFWFNTSDREMGVVMSLGLYEPSSVELTKKLIRPGMKCIDVGAQTGFYTCLMASLIGETGKVYAFEPMPSSHGILAKNIRENNFEHRVQLYQVAVSDVAGTIDGVMVSNMYVIGHVDGAQKVKLETVRIDDVINEPINIIKIDIEGHEPSAIRGMQSLLLKDRPTIISEANEYWLHTCSNSNANEYIELLRSFGYDVYNVENLDEPITSNSLTLDILDKIDIVAFPSDTDLRRSLEEDTDE